MNDHDALLRAIGEHPEEDTPRLMYADWLEENGQTERADFVRNQVELGRVGLDDPARRPLVVKNLYYLKNCVPEWKAELPKLSRIEWGDFNRGLIEEVQSNPTEEPVITHAATIFAVPGVHVLRIRWLVNGKRLASVPELARLRALSLVSANAGTESLRELFASPYLGKLAVLDLHGNGAGDALVAEIADGRFPELVELWLGANNVGNGGAMALVHSPHLEKLRSLDLRGNRRIDGSARAALLRRFGAAVKL